MPSIGTRAIVIAVRTPPSALKVQCVQPVFASSEYTMPLVVPTKTRPAATVGWPDADDTPGKPKAHFNVSFGTCAAVSPAAFSFWNREFAASLPQPFHIGIDAGSGSTLPAGHAPVAGSGAGCTGTGCAEAVAPIRQTKTKAADSLGFIVAAIMSARRDESNPGH